MTQCPTPQKKATKLFLFSTTPFPPSSLLLLGWWVFWNIAGLNWKGPNQVCFCRQRNAPRPLGPHWGFPMKTSAPLQLVGRQPSWKLGLGLWTDLTGAKPRCSANYVTVFTELLNTPQSSLLEVTWLSHLSFLYESYRFTTFLKILIFFSFSLSNALPPFFMLLTQTSKIMHLIKSIHLKTLKADWQAMSVSYSVNLRTIPGAH